MYCFEIPEFLPMSIRESLAEELPPERAVRKVSRVLRTHFRRVREVVIGPICPPAACCPSKCYRHRW